MHVTKQKNNGFILFSVDVRNTNISRGFMFCSTDARENTLGLFLFSIDVREQKQWFYCVVCWMLCCALMSFNAFLTNSIDVHQNSIDVRQKTLVLLSLLIHIVWYIYVF